MKTTEEQQIKEYVLTRRAEQISFTEIAKELNISYSTFRKFLKKHGLKDITKRGRSEATIQVPSVKFIVEKKDFDSYYEEMVNHWGSDNVKIWIEVPGKKE